VVFADLKAAMALLAVRDPEETRQLLDPVLESLMAAVQRRVISNPRPGSMRAGDYYTDSMLMHFSAG
jgi:hypothetical protein